MLNVSPPDSRRRKRRIFLLLSAIVIPSAVVILLVFRVVRQEDELSERRSAEAQREALDQLRRELSARLQAIRLEEVNRLIGESGRRLPPDSPIVFVAPLMQDRMVLPWKTTDFRRRQERVLRESRQKANHSSSSATMLRPRQPPANARWKSHELRGKGALHFCAWAVRIARQEWRLTPIEPTARLCTIALAFHSNDGIPLVLYAADRLLTAEKQ